MSKFDYDISKRIDAEQYPFYALVMATMRRADSDNMAKLEQAFPDVAAELRARYNAPGGIFASDQAGVR